jgi:uncharacterized membrane protein (DUF106 family)
MLAIITVTIVAITIGIIANIRMNREMDRIKELEDRLDEFYKQREQRLNNK